MISLGLSLWSSAIAPAVVAALFQDNFNDNSLDASLWNLAGYQDEATANHGTSNETNNRVESIPTAGSAGATGYVSNVRNFTGMSNYIHLANIPSALHDTYAYFAVGLPGAATYVGFTIQGTTLKAIRRQSAADTVFAGTNGNIAGTTALWLKITHNSSTGDMEFYSAPDSAANPPASGDWTLLGNVPFANLPTGFDITASVVAFGTYTWDGDIPTGVPAYFDGFNTAT